VSEPIVFVGHDRIKEGKLDEFSQLESAGFRGVFETIELSDGDVLHLFVAVLEGG
jgi:hypothetical protein